MPSQTPSQTVGPFFSFGLFRGGEEKLVNEKTLGERIVLMGRILEGDGEPVIDALVEIWQADARGIFNHPRDPKHGESDPHFRGSGRSQSVDDGVYRFETVKPGARDGAAPYINLRLFARGLLIHLVTRVYFEDEPANESDPTLATVDPTRRSTLIARRVDDGGAAVYRFDIRLQGADETVFFDV